MKMSQILTGIILTLVLILSQIVPAKAMPPIPCSFHGTVKINGENVPAGTKITAKIDGKIYAETAVVMYKGESHYMLIVPGEDSDTPGKQGGEDGETIVFAIGDRPAAQTAEWESGKNVELNLTAVTVPPVEGTIIYLPIIMKR